MSAFYNLADPAPHISGGGQAQSAARRRAVISGMPASIKELAAEAAKQDFQDRTMGLKMQAQADQDMATAKGIGGIAKLVGTMQKRPDPYGQPAVSNGHIAGGSAVGAIAGGAHNPDPWVMPPQEPQYIDPNQLAMYRWLMGVGQQPNYPYGMPPENY